MYGDDFVESAPSKEDSLSSCKKVITLSHERKETFKFGVETFSKFPRTAVKFKTIFASFFLGKLLKIEVRSVVNFKSSRILVSR